MTEKKQRYEEGTWAWACQRMVEGAEMRRTAEPIHWAMRDGALRYRNIHGLWDGNVIVFCEDLTATDWRIVGD